MKVSDDFMIEDRNPVPLAFCAHPTSTTTETREKDIDEYLLECIEPIFVANPDESRQAPSLKSYGGDTESEFEFSDGEDSEFENIKNVRDGALDSDDEFDRLVKFSAKMIEKTHKIEYPTEAEMRKQRKPKKTQTAPNVHEYDDLPPLENLSIECKSNLLEFGFVSKVVDCQVVIASTCTEVLDFDSYLFDEKGNSIGQVYDIFGQVKNPQYVVRFNSSEEASIMPIDMKIYYAPTDNQLSKTPFKGLNLAAANRETIRSLNRKLDHQAAVEKVAGRNQIVDVDSDVEFSDDEAEKQYQKSKRNVPMNPRPAFEANRGGRKRDRRGVQQVRFPNNPVQNAADVVQISAPKPYRRDYDSPQVSSPIRDEDIVELLIHDLTRDSNPATNNTQQAAAVRSPQSTETNPYAEFGCHGGFNGRFGI